MLRFSVTGVYANGRKRTAEFYWPAGSMESPEFKAKVQKFLADLQNNLIVNGSKTPMGLPKFEYIEVDSDIITKRDGRRGSVGGTSIFTLTPESYKYWLSEHRPNAAYYWKHEKELDNRRGIVKSCFVKDMSRYKSHETFWKSMLAEIEKLFQKNCKVPEASLPIY